MNFNQISFFLILLLSITQGHSQSLSSRLLTLNEELDDIELEKDSIEGKIASIKWSLYKDELKNYGLPSQSYLEHTAYFFEYSEEHEQAKWVAHMITPDIETLGKGRTEDFRIDPLVATGSAEQKDYFNYYPDKIKSEQYEGFGYDRGHLAPAADFRWFEEAVSESFYYSNMSPQHPEFNQGAWAKLEALLRRYVIRNQVSLAVVTAPVLEDDLQKVKQSPNGLSIPRQYLKIAYDPFNKRAIAFLMPNKKIEKPLESYAVTLDEIETLTGVDYFPNIDESIEAHYDPKDWFSEYVEGSVLPIEQNSLPRGYYNTITVASQINKYREVIVCGRVVSSRNSRSGNAWLNLDRKYPNDYFSVMIKKNDLTNFTYNPVTYLKNRNVCVEGQINKIGGKPVLIVQDQFSLTIDGFKF